MNLNGNKNEFYKDIMHFVDHHLPLLALFKSIQLVLFDNPIVCNCLSFIGMCLEQKKKINN